MRESRQNAMWKILNEYGIENQEFASKKQVYKVIGDHLDDDDIEMAYEAIRKMLRNKHAPK